VGVNVDPKRAGHSCTAVGSARCKFVAARRGWCLAGTAGGNQRRCAGHGGRGVFGVNSRCLCWHAVLGKVFFFEKKNQKTFVCWSLVATLSFLVSMRGLATDTRKPDIVVKPNPDGSVSWDGSLVRGYPALSAKFASAAQDNSRRGLVIVPNGQVKITQLLPVFRLAQQYHFRVGFVVGQATR